MVIQAICPTQTSVVADRKVARNPLLLLHSTVRGKAISEIFLRKMNNYYSDKLNSNKLRQCYDIAPNRVKQFLEAEINFVLQNVKLSDKILDLGCGYGRVTKRLISKAKQVIGIDISKDNIQLAKEINKNKGVQYYEMNAIALTFEDDFFDLTICIQNGISAFKVDAKELIKEALRVTKKGGKVLISSYSEKFWEERLNWFKIQAENGLIGEID